MTEPFTTPREKLIEAGRLLARAATQYAGERVTEVPLSDEEVHLIARALEHVRRDVEIMAAVVADDVATENKKRNES